MATHSQASAFGFGAILLAGPTTPIPGKSTTFKFMSNPALASPFVATFWGSDGTSQGIYQSDNTNALHVVVDDATLLPDLSGKFARFNTYLPLSVSDGDVAFEAWGSTKVQGIFVAGGGAIATIALAGDLCPAGDGSCVLQRPSLSGNALAFARARFDSSPVVQDALYLYSGASLKTVADTSTAIPNGTGTFDNFGPFMLDGGELAFIGGRGNPAQQMGVYRTKQGALERVADFSMIAPGAAERFSHFWNVAIWQGQIVFSASIGLVPSTGTWPGGLYRSLNGVLEVFADTNMPSPSGFGNFGGFGQASLSTGGLAFIGQGPNPDPHAGVYYRDSAGNLTTIADDVRPFFGESLSNTIDLCPQALNLQQLALAVPVKGVGTKVYVVYWPVT